MSLNKIGMDKEGLDDSNNQISENNIDALYKSDIWKNKTILFYTFIILMFCAPRFYCSKLLFEGKTLAFFAKLMNLNFSSPEL